MRKSTLDHFPQVGVKLKNIWNNQVEKMVAVDSALFLHMFLWERVLYVGTLHLLEGAIIAKNSF